MMTRANIRLQPTAPAAIMRAPLLKRNVSRTDALDDVAVGCVKEKG